VEIGQVQGLAIAQPWTAMALMIAGLALSALPPFASFVSEAQVVTALVAQGVPEQWVTSSGSMVTVALSNQFSSLGLTGLFLLCAVLAFGGLLYRITGMVWGIPPEGIVLGEGWTLGHLPIIILAAALVGFGVFLSQPIRQLLEQATQILLAH
jgi:hydrogenase-4 component F